MRRRDVLLAGVASLLGTTPAGLASAQSDYPSRPIKLVVPFASGGLVDIIGRSWAERVRPLLGTVVIENAGGAGGTIGAAEVAGAKPDGYTLLLGNTSTQIVNPMALARVNYDPVNGFAPIAILAISATSIVVHPAVPARSLQELIAYARANPGKLSYGSAGAGTMTNLAGELFKELTGTAHIAHVPYKGAGPGITDLVGGHIPMMTPNVTAQLLELHASGKVRILAVASSVRLKGAPAIPTATEAGLPGMVAQVFNGLFAAAGTPAAIIDKIAAATATVLAAQDYQELLQKNGFEPVLGAGPAQARAMVEEERRRLAPVVKAAGLAAR